MNKIKSYAALHFIIFIGSLISICSKAASSKELLSFDFFLLYGLVILGTIIYTFIWQMVIKIIPLNIAYSNKSVTLIWAMLWGALIFDEQVTLKNIIGLFIVVVGVMAIIRGTAANE